MFPKLSLIVTSVLAVGIALLSASISRVLNSSHQVAIAAAATVVPPSQPVSSRQCCNALLPNTAPAVTAISGLLGLDVSGLNVCFGLICTPMPDDTADVGLPIRCANPDIGWGGLFAVNCG
ncbi:hypothetical protein C8J57DRAFT_1251102 [Mycena rebaudengoi]|nr:hypothetical protein C8J57DRAFT_1251102 [Mycena rebaudengoi]